MKIIEAKGEYLFVQYDGVYSKSVLLELIDETHRISKELNCYKLLGDISRMSGKVSTMDRFEFGAHGSHRFQGRFKIAIVYRAEEINRFAETVSVNRGLNAKIFSKMDEALEWLGVKE